MQNCELLKIVWVWLLYMSSIRLSLSPLLFLSLTLSHSLSPLSEGEAGFDVSLEEFHSKKLRNKLVQQIHEPVVLASSALPDWCHTLTTFCSFLFPFEVREVFFASTALGMSRSVSLSLLLLFPVSSSPPLSSYFHLHIFFYKQHQPFTVYCEQRKPTYSLQRANFFVSHGCCTYCNNS